MEKRKWLSLLLAVTMLFTSIPVGMFAEGEEPVVEETATVEEVTIEEPAPAPEVKEEPAPAPAPEKKEEPAPAPEKKEEPAPVVEEKEEPAPVVEEKEEPAPVVEEKEEPAPVVEEKEEPAPSEGGESVPAEGTEPAAEPVATEEGEPEGDAVPEETGTEPAEDVTPVVEPEPVPEVEEVEEETEAFKAGLAYLSSGEVFEDKQLQKAYGTVNSKAVVYATDRITGEGELSGSDVIRISANIEGQEKTLYVKNGRLTYLSEDETAAYNDEKHEEGIACRGTKLDPVSFTPAEKPEPEVEPTEEPVPTEPTGEEPTEEPVPTEPTGEEPTETPVTTDPTGEEPTETPVTKDPTGEEPTETPVTTEPTGEEPTEEPVPTEPTVEEPTEEPVPAEPTVEEPTEEPVPTEPTVEEPTEEPVPAEPTGEEPKDDPEDVEDDSEEDQPIDITALITPVVPTEPETEAETEPETVEETAEEGPVEEEVVEAETETEETEEVSEEAAVELVLREAEEVEDLEERDGTSTIVITAQPQDVSIVAGRVVEFTVEATGSGELTYQWQTSTDGGTTWKDTGLTGNKTNRLYWTVTDAHNGRQYRCVLTDANGSLTSAAATLTIRQAQDTVTIITQPQDTSIVAGRVVEFTVEATGEGELTYQWQTSTDEGLTWNNTGLTGNKTDTLTWTVSDAHNGRQYRVIVSDANGSVTSDPATLTIVQEQDTITITQQPQNVSIVAGRVVEFTVAATGSGELSYQWQTSTDGGTTWKDTGLTGNKTSRLYWTALDSHNGRQYRCVVSDANGSKTTEAATLTIVQEQASTVTITTQPQDVSIVAGRVVEFTIAATGEGDLSYQWQTSTDGGTTWKDTGLTGNKTSRLYWTVSDSHNGRQYRCVVSDANGSVTSNAATLTIVQEQITTVTITTQPQDTSIVAGRVVEFTVAATGVGTLSYQWETSTDGGATWKNTGFTGNKTDTLTWTVTESHNGRKYRCVVSDANGSVTSDAATLTIVEETVPTVTITTQPQDTSIVAGRVVEFTVAATGVGTLSYQWETSTDGGATWKNTGFTGNKTDTLTWTVTESHNGRKYRCVVSDANGSVTSNAATLTIVEETVPTVTITTQPQDVSIVAGRVVEFTVAATGVGTLSYQWETSTDGGATWKNTGFTGNKTETLTWTVTESHNGRKYRCVVSDANGSVTSDAATLTIVPEQATVTIITQPQDTSVVAGNVVEFTIEATGVGDLSYQWQTSTDGGTTWKDTGLTGNKTDRLYWTATDAHNGRQYRCVVSDANGSVTSEAATLTIVEEQLDTVEITADPETIEARPGFEIVFTVEATGSGELAYQWEVSSDNGATWTPAPFTSSMTDTLAFIASAEDFGKLYRCVVTDDNGSATSEAALLELIVRFELNDVTYYILNDDDVMIESYDGTLSSVVIPETVQGFTVVQVGPGAFEGNTVLTSIDLPDTITVIAQRAFAGCSSLSDMH